MAEYLENKTLEEKQMRYYNAVYCVYCDSPTEFIDSGEVYQESHGMMYICKKCDAHVGTHKGSDQALGPVAKKELRNLRRQCHDVFDSLWRKKVEQGLSISQARKKAYSWLGTILQVDRSEAHIGYCSPTQCKKIISEVNKYIPGTTENIAYKAGFKYKVDEEYRIHLIEYLSVELEYDFTKISNYIFTLQKDGKKHKLDVRESKAILMYDDSAKWRKILDVEKFIKQQFKIKSADHFQP